MDGILVVNKPSGWTSHDVVAKARRILGTRRIGHAGTLDPAATGVLVLCIGRATRVVDRLVADEKEYRARAVFGEATDTQDAEGRIVRSGDASDLTREHVEFALADFTGTIMQIPPMVSALHHEGRRLYDLARQNQSVERTPREVTISDLQLEDFTPGKRAHGTLRVVCSKGTYVRTLVHDLGERLGVGAHLADLVRLRSGRFRIEDSFNLEDISKLAEQGRIGEKVLPIEEAVRDMPSYSVTEAQETTLAHGGRIALPTSASFCDGEEIAVFDSDGSLLALAVAVEEASARLLQPFKVFAVNDETGVARS